jgi:hypothetical protein
VNFVGRQKLTNEGDTAADADVFTVGRSIGLGESYFDSIGDEVKGCPHLSLRLADARDVSAQRRVYGMAHCRPTIFFHESPCHGPRTGPDMLRPRIPSADVFKRLQSEIVVDALCSFA